MVEKQRQGARFDTRTKLLQWPERLVEFKAGLVPEPLLCELYPTYACQLRCPWCDMGHTLLDKTDQDGHMPTALLLDVVRQLRLEGLQAINWSGGGEPTLHPVILEAVRLSKSLGMSNGMFTNGMWDHDEKLYEQLPPELTWVRFSLNSGFAKTLKGAMRVLKLKEEHGWETGVGLGVVVSGREDQHQFSMLVRLMLDAASKPFDYIQLRPDHLAKPHEVLKAQENAEELINRVGLGGDARVYMTSYKFSDGANWSRHYDKCYCPRFILTIGADGQVWHCPDMTGKDPKQWAWGSLAERPLSAILCSLEVRERIEGVDVHRCPPLCKGHETNKALWDMLNPAPESHPGHL